MPERIEQYIGPQGSIDPSQLDAFDKAGIWAAEVKHDGFWALARTDGHGVIVKLSARGGNILSDGETAHTEGILGLRTPLPDSELVAELETGTEAAKATYQVVGHKRLHFFDAPRINGVDHRRSSYTARRRLYEGLFADPTWGSAEFRKKVLLVEARTSGFRAFYDEVLARKGEGLVLKMRSRAYEHPGRASGKVDYWVRCKPQHHVDYAVIDISLTDLGQESLELALVRRGTLTRVGKVLAPPEWQKRARALVGRVVELKGAEVFKSGMLRHAAWVREREDKTPEMCEEVSGDC